MLRIVTNDYRAALCQIWTTFLQAFSQKKFLIDSDNGCPNSDPGSSILKSDVKILLCGPKTVSVWNFIKIRRFVLSGQVRYIHTDPQTHRPTHSPAMMKQKKHSYTIAPAWGPGAKMCNVTVRPRAPRLSKTNILSNHDFPVRLNFLFFLSLSTRERKRRLSNYWVISEREGDRWFIPSVQVDSIYRQTRK